MATRKQKIKVGVFLIVNVALLAVGLTLISGYRGSNREQYTVIFKGSVLGLYEGGLVHYQGVENGRVKSVTVGTDNQAHVIVSIDPKKVTLREGVIAKLEIYSLATGVMCVALYEGDPDGPPMDPEVPIIAEPSLVESISTEMGNLIPGATKTIEDLQEAVASLKDQFNALEEGQLAETLRKIDEIAANVNKGLEGMEEGQITEIVADVKDVVAKLNSSLEGLEEGGIAQVVADIEGTVGQLSGSLEGLEEGELAATLTDMGDIVEQIKTGLEGLEESDLTKLVDQANAFLDSTSTTVEDTGRSLSHSVDNLQHGLNDVFRKLDETLEAIRGLAEYLQQDPSSLVRGPGKKQGDN
ncbi:MAG: MCE family protein [bacterium]|nr:MCE family protein [bacterium]